MKDVGSFLQSRMLKNTLELLILSGLCLVLTYFIQLNQTELLNFYFQFNPAQQSRLVEQPSQISTRQTDNKPKLTTQPVQVDWLNNSGNQDGFQCIATPLDKITIKKKSRIYRWTDDAGKVHFSDSQFNDAATQQVNLKLRKELEYFSLKLSGDEQPTLFSDELSTRITKVYQLLSNMIPRQKLGKVTVDLKMFENHAEYDRYSRFFSKNLGHQADGYYIMRYNQAVVYKRNDEHAGQVALHESTHVINAGIFGYIPRWLDEGLAEYMENMTVTGQSAQIQPNASWIKNSRIKVNRMVSFNELFSAKRHAWNGSKQHSYYATSWALIYFLMSSEEGTHWLGSLLTEKAGKRCERTITLDYIDDFYPGGLYNLQQQFNRWLGEASSLSAHSY